MISVFLVDDHEIVRCGVADLIDDEEDLVVVGQAGTVAEAMVRIPAANPDIAVLDIRLPDGNGVELCRELRALCPDLNCLMLTSFTDEQAMLDAIMAGAGGYVIKDIRGMELLSAIRTVGSGRSLLDNRAASALMDRLRAAGEASPIAALTEQEQTLLELIGEGLTNRQISTRMFLSEKTIKNYVSRLLAKLGVERRTQAAVLATKLAERRMSAERFSGR
ncbi:response regulator [Mycobacteroides chelonae]|jgi:DNA-binding NarL/FixJ family response regulator|uniref:DNA-binding response regulator n=1 Tax=Mycobacteroides chelonae TaxID=1774 RepID=A0AB73MFW9_MYCCH|nr:response regulator transcription factor [Mycobacteroides chelonae]MBF9326989.1 response regulator transcription factor [Mycobacteroides chelonae]MBF9421166.1 response regulator transcription factor [Mycobacteroides chelonae]MBF9436643.1 response regulator transcription factor [Mycobacteroides chelonae]MBV6361068.1 response regulator transcription factor [Mycobacteroides chelonae]MEC4833424.1 response regulator transcription factor [Mycobacteroides chelonae]